MVSANLRSVLVFLLSFGKLPPALSCGVGFASGFGLVEECVYCTGCCSMSPMHVAIVPGGLSFVAPDCR